jgi:signal transduction histidine kinase
MIDPEMRLTIDLPDLVVVCDEVVVQMGVRNLMANAARHCESRIAVDARAAGDGEHLVIDISDDGLGLPEGAVLSDLTRIGAGREGSHGFGLASIAQVLQSRGGTLSIVPADTASALRGARFRMVFPGRIVSGGTRKAARALEDHTPRLLDQPHSGAA